MQFYNDIVKADFEKVDQLIQNLQIELGVSIYDEFREYVNIGKKKTEEQFITAVKKDVEPIISQAQETVNKQMTKNREEFEKQMVDHGKEKLDIPIEEPLTNFKGALKKFYDITLQEAYKKYLQMINDFGG